MNDQLAHAYPTFEDLALTWTGKGSGNHRGRQPSAAMRPAAGAHIAVQHGEEMSCPATLRVCPCEAQADT
jgi:hypothetical protein